MASPDWIETSEVLPLFPTFVWKTQIALPTRQAINHQAERELRRLAPHLEPRQSWQSHQRLHELKAFSELLPCVHHSTAKVLEFLKTGYREFEVTACWATINAPGRGQGVHAHPNSYLSGVYYVQTQSGADSINFHDPRIQTGIIRPPVTELVAANADQAVIKVIDGTMLLFPSWLQHSVDPNTSDRERVSVSFNLMFSAYTEKLCKPLWGDP